MEHNQHKCFTKPHNILCIGINIKFVGRNVIPRKIFIFSHRKFYGRHDDLVINYGISVSQMITVMFPLLSQPHPFLIHDLASYFDMSNTTGVTSGACLCGVVLCH